MDDYQRDDWNNTIEPPNMAQDHTAPQAFDAPQNNGTPQNDSTPPDSSTPQDNGAQMRSTHAFAVASMIFGISSILLLCTGLLPLPLGALGMLFAILSRRRERPMSGMSVTGMVTSLIGMALGIVIMAYLAAMVSMALNPATRHYLDPIYQNAYGMSFEEFMEYIGYPVGQD